MFSIFPAALVDISLLTAVLVGVLLLWWLAERFGWPATGLVVPGYAGAVLCTRPEAALVILLESVITFGLAHLVGRVLPKWLPWDRSFGSEPRRRLHHRHRDRHHPGHLVAGRLRRDPRHRRHQQRRLHRADLGHRLRRLHGRLRHLRRDRHHLRDRDADGSWRYFFRGEGTWSDHDGDRVAEVEDAQGREPLVWIGDY